MILYAKLDENGCPVEVGRAYSIPDGFVEVPHQDMSISDVYRIMYDGSEWVARPIVTLESIPPDSEVMVYEARGGKVVIEPSRDVSDITKKIQKDVSYVVEIHPPSPYLSAILDVKV